MSTELVDPFAPEPERLKTSDMRADINARILTSSQNDPPLCPQLVQKTLDALDEATAGESVTLASWARRLLEELHHRAVTGIPYGEPAQPAWSLDSDRSEHFIRHVDDVVDDL